MDVGRYEGEDILMNMINEGDDDGSQYLNDSGEGVEDLDRRDGSGEGMEGEYDGTVLEP